MDLKKATSQASEHCQVDEHFQGGGVCSIFLGFFLLYLDCILFFYCDLQVDKVTLSIQEHNEGLQKCMAAVGDLAQKVSSMSVPR